EVEQLAIHYPIQTILSGVSGKRTKEENARVLDYYLTYEAPDVLQKLYGELKSLRTEKDLLDKAIPTVMVMSEMEKPRETFVLGRGDYRNKTDKVSPCVPAVLPPLPQSATTNCVVIGSVVT